VLAAVLEGRRLALEVGSGATGDRIPIAAGLAS
jgi:hypothetical protein